MNVSFSDNGALNPGGEGPHDAAWQGNAPTEISAQSAQRIEECLADLVAEVGLDFAAVLDDGGAVLGWSAAEDGESSGVVEVLVDCSGALAMGAFAAAETLAAQLGGEASREMIHHAGSRSFYLTEVSRGVALFSVWSDAVALGFLRERASWAVQNLRQEVAQFKGSLSEAGEPLNADGLSAAPDRIDFPSHPEADLGQSDRRFSSASSIHRGSGDRYIFEIG